MKKLVAMILVMLLALSSATFAFAEYKDKGTVKQVQQALNDAGYECGKPDGSAGKKTKAAITQYQTDKGMEVTGAIDDALLEALGVELSDEIKAEKAAEEAKALFVPDQFVEKLNAAIAEHVAADGLDPESDEVKAALADYSLAYTKDIEKEIMYYEAKKIPNLMYWLSRDKKKKPVEPVEIDVIVEATDGLDYYAMTSFYESIALSCRAYGLELEQIPEISAILGDMPGPGETVGMDTYQDTLGGCKIIRQGDLILRFMFYTNGIRFTILREANKEMIIYFLGDNNWEDVTPEEMKRMREEAANAEADAAYAAEVFSDMPPIPEDVAEIIGHLPTSVDQLWRYFDVEYMQKLYDTIKPAEALKALMEDGVYTFDIEEDLDFEEAYIFWGEEEKDIKINVSNGQVTLKVDPPKNIGLYVPHLYMVVNGYAVNDFDIRSRYVTIIDSHEKRATLDLTRVFEEEEQGYSYCLYVGNNEGGSTSDQWWYIDFDENGQMTGHRYEEQ